MEAQTLSFYPDHIARLLDKLVSLGILLKRPGQTPSSLMLSALTEEHEAAASMAAPGPAPHQNVTWQPSSAIEELLNLNHGIPRQFIERAAAQFLPAEGREVDTQFRQFVLGRWREHQQSQAPQTPAFEINTPPPFGKDWVPSQDALDILSQARSILSLPNRCARNLSSTGVRWHHPEVNSICGTCATTLVEAHQPDAAQYRTHSHCP